MEQERLLGAGVPMLTDPETLVGVRLIEVVPETTLITVITAGAPKPSEKSSASLLPGAAAAEQV